MQKKPLNAESSGGVGVVERVAMVFQAIGRWVFLAVFLAFLGAGQGRAQSAGPEQVFVGAYINDIQQLDLKTHSYAVDMYVWFRWKNPDFNPMASVEFMNSFARSSHVLTPLFDKPEDLPGGWKYTAFRNQGQFTTKLPLQRYPFDQQHLNIEFEDSTTTSDKLVFVPDKLPVVLNPDIGLPGYIIGDAKLTIKDRPYTTVFGDTRDLIPLPYSRVTISVPVHRPTFTNAVKVFVPLLLIIACAALIFFIHPGYVEGRIGMGITSLLTLVALQLTTNSSLPDVDYLLMIDQLYFAAYLFIICTLAQIVRGSWLAHRDEVEVAARLDGQAFRWLLLGYIGISGLIVWNALDS